MNQRPIVANSGDKHGISEDDLLHAYHQVVRIFEMDEGLKMRIGADRSGNPTEVGVVRSEDGIDVIVHAMRARSKFLR